jgi:hypothetical protein
VIKDGAFEFCSQWTTLALGEGLKEIGEEEFSECTSLHDVVISPAVHVIRNRAFSNCMQLRTVVLCEVLFGLERGHFADANLYLTS